MRVFRQLACLERHEKLAKGRDRLTVVSKVVFQTGKGLEKAGKAKENPILEQKRLRPPWKITPQSDRPIGRRRGIARA